ncbi:zinc finger protein GLIS2-like isoform X1 [Trichoplusia ni]|uniref:Zinc finger protein GLIS2-like isoform X1 n=1 Tax=Trichoplusia ni TaxID=7111 RepID=A0A7E5VC53_TRINI|nr:zinc finger protein GLIS2-like isoform X1 [Trichoplusia ni]
MLVFPAWRSDIPRDGCRVQRWMPAERFAPYFARPVVLPPRPPQLEDEVSSGGSSPDRSSDTVESPEGVCLWQGCGAHFQSVTRLSAHVARTHALAHRDGLFYCGWKGCTRPQRGFNARYKMLVHVRTHTNERPHTCNQCNKSFSRAENLKIHLRSHSGEKPYVCPYEGCGKAYSNSSDRFKHTRTHAVEKPYCCKVVGCNKRYTDPSSLRKHVKTYKHYTTEQIARRESSDEVHSSDAFSPSKENSSSYTVLEPTSPVHGSRAYTSPVSSLSPPRPTYTPMMADQSLQITPYQPRGDQVTYIRTLEPIYPVRIPTNEMSYMEYTQMYEHAYRNYYNNSIPYPTLGASINEKVYTYENQSRLEEVPLEKVDQSPPGRMYSPMDEEMPLNLICSKRLECKPIEQLIRRTDLPLDLSTKS